MEAPPVAADLSDTDVMTVTAQFPVTLDNENDIQLQLPYARAECVRTSPGGSVPCAQKSREYSARDFDSEPSV